MRGGHNKEKNDDTSSYHRTKIIVSEMANLNAHIWYPQQQNGGHASCLHMHDPIYYTKTFFLQ